MPGTGGWPQASRGQTLVNGRYAIFWRLSTHQSATTAGFPAVAEQPGNRALNGKAFQIIVSLLTRAALLLSQCAWSTRQP